MTLKQQVANLMNEGFTARQIFDRLKPMHPNTTIGSIAFNVSVLKKRKKVEEVIPNAGIPS
jgi:hypothetical protein